nr:uncharacterized protein LOC121829670 [Peromyscus maniculatus bairdii]
MATHGHGARRAAAANEPGGALRGRASGHLASGCPGPQLFEPRLPGSGPRRLLVGFPRASGCDRRARSSARPACPVQTAKLADVLFSGKLASEVVRHSLNSGFSLLPEVSRRFLRSPGAEGAWLGVASAAYCHGDQKLSAAEAGGCEPDGAARGAGAPGSARRPETASRADRSGFRVGSSVCRECPRPDARIPASRDRTAPGSARSARLTVGEACHEGASAARAEPRTKPMAWTRPGPARGLPEPGTCHAGASVRVQAGARGRVPRAHACPPESVSRLSSRTTTSESEPRRIAVGNGAPDCPWKKVIRKTGRVSAAGEPLQCSQKMLRAECSLGTQFALAQRFGIVTMTDFPPGMCQESNSTLQLQNKAVDSSMASFLKMGVWERVKKMKIWGPTAHPCSCLKE